MSGVRARRLLRSCRFRAQCPGPPGPLRRRPAPTLPSPPRPAPPRPAPPRPAPPRPSLRGPEDGWAGRLRVCAERGVVLEEIKDDFLIPVLHANPCSRVHNVMKSERRAAPAHPDCRVPSPPQRATAQTTHRLGTVGGAPPLGRRAGSPRLASTSDATPKGPLPPPAASREDERCACLRMVAGRSVSGD